MLQDGLLIQIFEHEKGGRASADKVSNIRLKREASQKKEKVNEKGIRRSTRRGSEYMEKYSREEYEALEHSTDGAWPEKGATEGTLNKRNEGIFPPSRRHSVIHIN